jgi:very-short-patch-repair endonuclease
MENVRTAPALSLSRERERAGVRARRLRQASPDAELKIWNRLRNRQLAGFKFRRQHPVGPFFADFACIEAGLIVELDGSQHFEPDAMVSDRQRTRVLERFGFEVLRFDDRQALLETDGVLESILQRLETPRPHPNPLPQAGEGAHAHAKD